MRWILQCKVPVTLQRSGTPRAGQSQLLHQFTDHGRPLACVLFDRPNSPGDRLTGQPSLPGGCRSATAQVTEKGGRVHCVGTHRPAEVAQFAKNARNDVGSVQVGNEAKLRRLMQPLSRRNRPDPLLWSSVGRTNHVGMGTLLRDRITIVLGTPRLTGVT
jgi:hypothetical protein